MSVVRNVLAAAIGRQDDLRHVERRTMGWNPLSLLRARRRILLPGEDASPHSGSEAPKENSHWKWKLGGSVLVAVVAGSFGLFGNVFEPKQSPAPTLIAPLILAPSIPETRSFNRRPTLTDPMIVTSLTEWTGFGWTSAPNIQAEASDDGRLTQDSLFVQLGKIGDSPPILCEEWIKTTPKVGGGSMIIDLDTADVIKENYAAAPHGAYEATLRVCDGPDSCAEKSLFFNYVYRNDFSEYKETMTLGSHGIFSHSDKQFGLRIKNPTRSEGWVGATLRQQFSFRRNMYVRGVFLAKCDDESNPIGLDVSVCDTGTIPSRPYEKIAVVIPDGGVDRYSIKIGNEEYGRPATVVVAEGGQQIHPNGVTRYSFMMLVYDLGKYRSRCDLYVGVDELTPENIANERVHTREFASSLIGHGLATIKIKIRKRGTVRLMYIEIGEITPTIKQAWAPVARN